MNENNTVKTYNLSGKFMYESHHCTADEAYKEYCNIIENLKQELPKGFGATVVRERFGKVQSMVTVLGTK